jgi:hypothetical protein
MDRVLANDRLILDSVLSLLGVSSRDGDDDDADD